MHSKRTLFVALLVSVCLILGTIPATAQDTVTIRWFVGLGAGGQPEQVEAQNAVVELFNSTHDNIQLEIEIVDNTVAYDALSTLIATGDAPDIVGPVGLDASNSYAGLYLDLTEQIEASGYDLSQFDEAAVDSYRTSDGLVGLPFATFPSFIFFRPSQFDEAGMNYPPQEYGAPYVMPDGTEVEWNLDTLREVAMELTVDSDGFFASEDEFTPENTEVWGYISQWNDVRGFASLCGGANPIDENGDAVLPEEWDACLNWYYDGIWEDHFIPSDPEINSDLLGGAPFASGNVAMAHSHLWLTCCLGEGELAEDWDIAVMPSFNGQPTAKLHGDTFRIMASTDHPAEAFEVLTFLLGEASPTLLQVYGGMPARTDQTEVFFAGLDERFPQGVNWDVAVASLAYADSPNHESWMPNYNRVKDRIDSFQSLLLGTEGLDLNSELESMISDIDVLFEEFEAESS